jgi:hypothetical protein
MLYFSKIHRRAMLRACSALEKLNRVVFLRGLGLRRHTLALGLLNAQRYQKNDAR